MGIDQAYFITYRYFLEDLDNGVAGKKPKNAKISVSAGGNIGQCEFEQMK